VDWYPQEKQALLLEAAGLLDCVMGNGGPKPPIAPLIGYGGAAYGGKTDAQLGLATVAAFAFPGCNIGFFRRTFPELNVVGGVIKRSMEILNGIATYLKDEHTWTFPNGSRLQFCYAQGETEVLKYKSSQFDILLIDEATTFTWFMVDYLLTRNRATVDNIQPFAVMTTNPGDVGHSWYMQLFDTVNALGPHNRLKMTENMNSQHSQVYFIPAFIEDNVIGLERDPQYGVRLAQRDPEVARALLKGDWTIFAGQAFPQWRYDKHVTPYQELPPEWPMWRSMDYGWGHPFVTYWWKQNPLNGRRYLIRELAGIHMTDPEIIQAIKTASLPDERILFNFASPDMWAAQRADKVPTTAAQNFMQAGIILTRADDSRIPGKMKINNLLADLPDGQPGLVVFDTCPQLIKLMPTLVRDKLHAEDVKKFDAAEGKFNGDDPYDAMRYGLTNYTLPQNMQPKRQPKHNPMREVFRV
jgi:hypothetical protein